MNYRKESCCNTRKYTTNDAELLSTYRPPRIVLSSQISRKDLNSNPEETYTEEYEKCDDVDELFQNLSEQMQDKLKQCRENKDKLELSKISTRRANNFVSEFLEVKKRFEADFVANTRIYQSSSQSLKNSETIRDVNNEECQLQMSSADKYVAMLQSQETAQSNRLNKAVNKYYSLKTQNWVPGAVMTKIKVDSDGNSSVPAGLIKNQETFQNSDVNNQEKKKRDKVKNRQLYGFTYKSDPSFKMTKSKKKSFIEEFCELRDKLGVTPKSEMKNLEENLETFNAGNKRKEAPGSSLTQKQGTEKINNRIITPFDSIRTSFFSNYNPTAETPKSNRRKRGSTREDITADWVKGDVIQRGEKITKNFIDSKNSKHTLENMDDTENLYCDMSPSYVLQNSKSIEQKSELHFTPRNEYIRASPSNASVNNTPKSRKNEQIFEKDYCTSAITMSTMLCSRNIKIHRPNFVITETKVTKLMFPSHQMKLFQRQ